MVILMEYNQILKGIFIDFLSHPLVVGLILFVLGRFFILDKFLPDKRLTIKLEIISNIIEIQNKIKLVKMMHDGIIQKLAFKKDADEYYSILKPEYEKIINIINNGINKLIVDIDSRIIIFFDEKCGTRHAFNQYNKALTSINEYMIINFGWTSLEEKNSKIKVTGNFNFWHEPKFLKFMETEKELIMKINNERVLRSIKV